MRDRAAAETDGVYVEDEMHGQNGLLVSRHPSGRVAIEMVDADNGGGIIHIDDDTADRFIHDLINFLRRTR